METPEISTPTDAGDDDANMPPARPGVRVIAARDLLQGASEVHIAHADALYVLRLTRQNKLILTK